MGIIVNGRFLTMPINGIFRFALELCKQLKKHNIQFVIIVISQI